MKNRSILIIGYDTNICLGVLYCLKDIKGSIYLLTNKKNNPAKHSRYLTGYYEYSDFENKNEIIEKVIKIVKENLIGLIMPVDENEGRLISEYKETLTKYASCTWLPSIDKFDIGVNKRKLAECLLQNNIPCPAFTTVTNSNDLFTKANEFGYPVLVKPSRGFSGRLIKKIYNRNQLEDFAQKGKSEDQEFILQPYIEGSDIDCSVLCKDGEIICYTIQRALSNEESSFKPRESIEFVDDLEVLDASSRMMKMLNWNGVAHIDLRRDKSDNKVKILEINGRFWASVVTSYLKAGVNFPLILVKLSAGEKFEILGQKNSKQLSFKDYLILKLSFKEKVSLKDTKYSYYKSDPIARVFQILEKVKIKI